MSQKLNNEDGNSYQTHVIQLTRELSTRAGNTLTKDEDFVNVLFELVREKNAQDTRSFLMKRSGSTPLISSVAASEVRGQFFWEDQGKFLYVVDRNVYVYTVSTGITVTLLNVFASGTTEIGFTEYLYDTNVVVVIATDGTTLVQIDSANVVTTCVDADMPVHIPCVVFIDGYILVIKKDTADIYNSDLNNPLSWTPGNFITAEMSPDLLRKLCKVNNYVVALGSESAEYFWDAGNSTGSPLSRNDSPIKVNTFLGGLSQYGNDIYYIGKSVGGQPSVFMLKDFKIDEVASPSIKRYLALIADNISTWTTSILSMQGHTLLIIDVGSRSYTYDLDEKLWSRFAYQNTEVFNIKYATKITTSTSGYILFSMKDSTSTIHKFDDTLMQDNGVNYTVQIITEQANFGTTNRKTMPRFGVYGDRTPADSNLEVSWTDDDFQTFSTPRTINLNQDFQGFYNLGSFRQRAFKLRYTGQYIMRLQSIEVDINKGIA